MDSMSKTPNEADRQTALDNYDILDSPPDAVLDCITEAAKDLCEVPIALISLVDTSRQWFKSKVGLSVSETPRDVAFCSHAIQNPGELMEVEDATQDERFRDNPLVTDEPKIRFYAGQPLVTSDGFALGTLCVIDYTPRQLSPPQRKALGRLAAAVVTQFEKTRESNTTRIKQNEIVRLRDRAIDAIDVGVSITDARKENHPLVYVNKTLCTMTGYTAEELIGQGVRVLQKDNQHQPEHLKIEAAQAKGEAVQVLFKSTRKDGSSYMDELTLSPIHNSEGELTHYIGINKDVTAKLDIEARLQHSQKIESLGQLSGGVAHDFNNILSVIIGNIEFLAMDISNAEHCEYLTEADTAAKMGARLTRRLLTFAKQGKLEPVVLSANEYALSALDILRSTIGENIALCSKLSSDLWTIRADPSEIENTIVNLAINARDAMPNGGKIAVSTRNATFSEEDIEEGFEIVPGDYIQLSVSDTGTGMTDEVKARIFEPFFTTKEQGKGTGLGLASIYGFARQSGGQVHVYSELGHGTVINVYLPRHHDNVRETQAAQPTVTDSTVDASRVLVVEDNDMVRKVTLKRLSALGFDTQQASNGPEAVSILENDQRFDLVLSDIVMTV